VTTRWLSLVVVGALLALTLSCHDNGASGDGDANTDPDADGDTNSDANGDTNSDANGDTNSDADWDTDSDADTDSEAPRQFIDFPELNAQVSGQYRLVGWATDASGVSAVVLALDTVILALADFDYGKNRPGVCTDHADLNDPNCPNVGWAGTLDTTEYADGEHLLEVTAHDASGNSETLSRPFVIDNSNTDGIVNLSKMPGTPSVHASVLAYSDKVMVTWREEEFWDIYFTILDNGAWSTPAPVFDTNKISKNPHIVEGADGAVHITWGEGSVNREIEHAVYRNATWGSRAQIFSSPKNSNWARVVVLDDGTANIVWTSEQSAIDDQVIRNNWKPAGGSWDQDGLIVDRKDPEESTGHADIAARGNMSYVVWREDGPTTGMHILFAEKQGNGVWSTPVKVDTGSGINSYARIAVDSQGDLHVLWENGRRVGYNARINGAWGSQVQINEVNGKHPNFLDIDVDPDDGVHAVYVVHPDDTRSDIYYNFKEAGGVWNRADDVRVSTSSTLNQLPAISVDDQGRAHLVWSSRAEGVPGDIFYKRVDP